MERRNLELSARVEDVRDPLPSRVVHFDLVQIKSHFDESLLSIKKQFDIADELLANGKAEEAKTIWRSQIVFVEGILDFYIHEISKYALYKMFTGNWPPSDQYKSLRIPMKEVESALQSGESKEWFFDFLNSLFARDVFLSAESMKDQLNLVGIGFGPVMCKAFPKRTANESHRYGRSVVNALFTRRNEIAHQIDRNHASAVQNNIDKTFVEEKLQEVESIVSAIQLIAEENG